MAYSEVGLATRELYVTLLSAIGTLGIGLIANYLYHRLRELRRKSEATTSSLASLVESRQAKQRFSVLQLLAEKLPPTSSPEEFFARLEPLVIKLTSTPRVDSPSMAPAHGLVSAYHEQALSQSRVQFWFSVVAAAVGFIWILYSAGEIDVRNPLTATKVLPGTIIDAVAYLFLKQAAETRQRATELYDRLRKDRELSDSVVLVAAIEDPKVRSAVRAQLALHMSGLQPAPIDLTSFISGSKQ